MISFSFGKNWISYLKSMPQQAIDDAQRDIERMLGRDFVRGKRVIDVGSGSGIHSLAFHKLGAKSVASFDVDPFSVEATRSLWRSAGEPETWTVGRGSILDEAWLQGVGRFDLVYSWGVLHHTGAMWRAVDNAARLVEPAGRLWIALYMSGGLYPTHLALKQRYNRASDLEKRLIEAKEIARLMYGEARRLRNPLGWNKTTTRGMNTYHDIVDWLGGLPYEVASPDEVVVRLRSKGFIAERIMTLGEGSCGSYVFTLDPRGSPSAGEGVTS